MKLIYKLERGLSLTTGVDYIPNRRFDDLALRHPLIIEHAKKTKRMVGTPQVCSPIIAGFVSYYGSVLYGAPEKTDRFLTTLTTGESAVAGDPAFELRKYLQNERIHQHRLPFSAVINCINFAWNKTIGGKASTRIRVRDFQGLVSLKTNVPLIGQKRFILPTVSPISRLLIGDKDKYVGMVVNIKDQSVSDLKQSGLTIEEISNFAGIPIGTVTRELRKADEVVA